MPRHVGDNGGRRMRFFGLVGAHTNPGVCPWRQDGVQTQNSSTDIAGKGYSGKSVENTDLSASACSNNQRCDCITQGIRIPLPTYGSKPDISPPFSFSFSIYALSCA